ncbi:MAG: topoisomerase IV [Methanobrevibacter thaueri]|jgi:uncharacterized protein with PQ loop repeat|uniref:Topoisomerase IV n=1 Tax=Methanobrevibacter thaueri TaxID=190975 RepID=A0A8T3V7P6_9EURY|nr:topoisomerase IV [Methanobrevibacter thaueri]MBE6502321.1 topoisomerase IV [Methanobrevibacter thaueri]
MKDSKKEHRISNLKDMIDNVTDESYEQIEEDSELIDYLNQNKDDFEVPEIDDEFIYRPNDEYNNAINLEETPINEDYIIKAPKSIDSDKDEYDDFEGDLVGEISENFDNAINAKVRGRSILAIISSVLGIILVIISIFIFQSRSDRVIDNVVAGESSFMFVVFLIAGVLLLIYGIYRLFNIKNPFEKITSSIDSIDNEKKDNTNTKNEEPSQKPMPKSEIPLDKDAYKIGEFDVNDLKTSLKKPTASTKKVQFKDNIDDLPPAKKTLTEEEIEEIEYEHAKLESESIDDIFAEVEDIEEVPIITLDSKERQE